jgi:hypothetical protein
MPSFDGMQQFNKNRRSSINDSPEPPASSGDITECEADPVQSVTYYARP